MNIKITFEDLTLEQAKALLSLPTYPVEELPFDEHIEIPAPSFEGDPAPVTKTRKPRAKKNTTEAIDSSQPIKDPSTARDEKLDISTPPPPPPPQQTFNDFMKKVTGGLIGGKYPMELVDAILATNGLKTLLDAQTRPDLWDNITKGLGV